jgi:hypothetical protein
MSQTTIRNAMTEFVITQICQLCGRQHFFGDDHRYDGKFIAAYKIQVCKGCLDGNFDGLAPHYEEAFEAHLAKHGIPVPQRNAKGLYPLPAWG